MIYAVYNSNTGEILRTGYCPEEMINLQFQDGEVLVKGEFFADRQYFVNGEVANFTEGEIQAMNNVPKGHVWKMPDRAIVDMRDFDTAKTQAWERVKAYRAEAENSTFICNGLWYQTDLARIPGAALMAFMAQVMSQPYSETWTLADNTTVNLDAAGMIAVGIAQAEHIKDVFAIGRDLRDAVNNANTIDDVDAIVWP